VLRHVQRHRCLPDRWAGGQDDEVRWLEAAEQCVQLRQAGRDADDLSAVLVQVLQPVIRLAEEDGQCLEAAVGPPLADLEQD
jgi:hypothetical protein